MTVLLTKDMCVGSLAHASRRTCVLGQSLPGTQRQALGFRVWG